MQLQAFDLNLEIKKGNPNLARLSFQIAPSFPMKLGLSGAAQRSPDDNIKN
jgi:hypothetical protein